MEPDKTLEDNIARIAAKYAPDYPQIDTCETWEKLYAIEGALDGLDMANQDLHKILEYYRERDGHSISESIRNYESILKN